MKGEDDEEFWCRIGIFLFNPFPMYIFTQCLVCGVPVYFDEPSHKKVSNIRFTSYVLVNVQAARRYRIYSEAVDYTGRGRSPRPGIVNS